MLYDDLEKEEIKIDVPRLSRGDGTFVMFRFRNKADLDKFSEIIDEPRLKALKKNSLTKITWHSKAEKRNALDQFFD